MPILLIAFLMLFLFADKQSYASNEKYVWKQVPLYSEEYRPRRIKEGFQMTHALAYAPSNPSIVYLCTDTSRVWRSSDGGESWKQAGAGMISNGCRSLAIDPVNPNRVLAAGFLGVNEKKSRHRKWKFQALYLTENGGKTWKVVSQANFYRQISKSPVLAYDSTTSKKDKTYFWYAGAYDQGLLISKDGGFSWKTLAPELLGICGIQEIPGTLGHLMIATESGLYLYNKKEVIKIGKGLPKDVCAIVIHPADSNIVIAAAGKWGIYRSIDGGKNFSASNSGLFLIPPNMGSLAISKKPPYIIYAKAHKSNFRLPFYSKNAGLSWKQGKYGEFVQTHSSRKHFWFSSALAPHPENPKQCLTVSSGDGKVFKTTDGGATWKLFGSGYTGARVMDMSFDKKGMVLALTDFGIWIKKRNDEYFRDLQIPRFNGASSSHLVVRANDMIVATVGTWDDQCLAIGSTSNGWKLYPELHGRFRFLAVHPKDPNIIYADNLLSQNKGKTWTQLPKPVSAISEAAAGRVYALDSGENEHQSFISVSENFGASWRPLTPPVPIEKSQITRLVPDPYNIRRFYLATHDGVWVFDGKVWSRKADKDGLARDHFGLIYISALVVDPIKSGRLFAGRAAPGRGMSNGIFMSDDGGESWHNIMGNIENDLYVWSLHFDTVDNTLYADTDRGLIKLDMFIK